MDKTAAEALLQTAVNNPEARFRDGQWEAIDALVNQRQKLLVVQRTGWGKSSVYFISTKFLRDRGAGPTIIISPLLALMRNQIDAAQRLGLVAQSINSNNRNDWPQINQALLNQQIDVLLISPERLANEEFVANVLMPIAGRIGLFVVDEAHCISDWGHDFRPDYRRLVNILRQMPENMPVLGTTATANNRVIEDIQKQLGNIGLQRGPLVRDSLVLQTLKLPDQASRLAWLAQHISQLPGTGIIYALTQRDAQQVADWLTQHGIDARAYHGGVEQNQRLQLESLLLNNKIKVLVATSALGMGYDKPDLGFVIHYQAPGSVISCYQQVGRAGRAIDKAYGILLSGREDEDIHYFFRRTAFPDEAHVNSILDTLSDHDELSLRQIENHLNLGYGQIDKVLKLLSVETPAPVMRDGGKWFRTPVPFAMDRQRIEYLTQQRELEWREIQNYIDNDKCLMAYLQNALDDPRPVDCGRCSSCLGRPIIGTDVEKSTIIAASRFLKQAEIPFRPKIQVASGAFEKYGFSGNLPTRLRASEGRILSRWGDAGWGELVSCDKQAGRFRDELVEAMVQMIEQRWQPEPEPQWVTCIPSHRHRELVPGFARRLAMRLKLPFVDAIAKIRDNEPQKSQQNRFHQCRNLDGAFQITTDIPETAVLLVDDVIDSGWTVTVLAALLQQAGSGPVYPLALATTSTRD